MAAIVLFLLVALYMKTLPYFPAVMKYDASRAYDVVSSSSEA